MIAAKKIKSAYPNLETVVTLLCDRGEKYIQEHFVEKGVRADAEIFA